MIRTEHNIFQAVAAEYNVTIEQILSNSRLRHTSEARHIAMFMLYEEFGYTLAQIADIFKRSHPTITYAISKMKYFTEKDKVTRLRHANICILLGINKTEQETTEA